MPLFNYQEEGVKFLLSHDSVLLADEMGTGKTIQTSVALDHRSPVLIVCPNGVKLFWIRALLQWGGYTADELEIYRTGDNKIPDFFNQKGIKVYVMHWEALRFNEAAIRARFWDTVVADEAHRMKGRKTLQSKAIRAIKARRKIALTGTPIINRADEIWGILNFLFPDKYKSYWRFVSDVLITVPQPFGGIQVLGYRDPKGFRQLLTTFMLRRLKVDVLKQLPPKMYTDLQVELTSAQRKVYDQLRKEMIAKITDDEIVRADNALTMLMRLRQIACGLELLSSKEESSKLDAAVQLIEDADKPVVVFSQFVDMVTSLKKRLEAKKISCGVIHGSITQKHRDALVDAFQEGEIQVLAMTTATGGTGLTLTKSDTVLFLDDSWSPAVKAQAEDRIHRIGQTATSVQIITLIATNTVEERIARLLKYKATLLQTAFSGKELKEIL